MSELIGGLQEVFQVLKESVVLPLQYPELFMSGDKGGIQMKCVKGILLHGPPGTGKTLLMKNLMQYCQSQFRSTPISFFSRRGPDLLSKYHGETERNLRSLFQRAKQCAPSVIFFDEIDGLCPIRSHKHEQVHNSVVTTLLSLMDGLEKETRTSKLQHVFVIAATNRIDNIDPALRRPGRFDRELCIGLPGSKARLEILRIHCQKWPNFEQMTTDDQWNKYFQTLVQQTVGLSGADLQYLCNQAFWHGVRRIFPNLCDTSADQQHFLKKIKESNFSIEIQDFQTVLRADSSISKKTWIHFPDVQDLFLDHRLSDLFANLLKRVQFFFDCSHINVDLHAYQIGAEQQQEEKERQLSFVHSQTLSPCSMSKLGRILYHDHLLLSCDEDQSARLHLLLRLLLLRLEQANIEYVTFPYVMAEPSLPEMYRLVTTQVLQALRQHDRIGVIVIPDIHCLLLCCVTTFFCASEQTPSLRQFSLCGLVLQRNLLLTSLSLLKNRHSFLVIATSSVKWSISNAQKFDWPMDVFRFFNNRGIFSVDQKIFGSVHGICIFFCFSKTTNLNVNSSKYALHFKLKQLYKSFEKEKGPLLRENVIRGVSCFINKKSTNSIGVKKMRKNKNEKKKDSDSTETNQKNNNIKLCKQMFDGNFK
ncbi:hypothetical protein RFI_09199 [Reticulomyxa filosa]|uniref:AAA+ ATPase domain-containing protein n=1 Tax=Reticulomyxa filosa TaxID=46433 RepID=X6NQH1_RETFI|nr:hypothetical protein RFI_09199 [Reticulomyxa filosa]|eukprot:ETO27934.1 hypothetical protein RFI_09199 [Reticulomyxa filosa]